MSLLAETSLLLGRLAFAAVFLALICWLILMPKQVLNEGETAGRKPIWKQIRTWAVVIATVQMLIYLFWK